ncbi:helix-turn-helix domain-containing protein [Deinococcus aerolatus]|uniref:helix-turn-helix domain-containing protein n=1 Tax=Deinococcus aerolatus TaxID=522487 RepID=UPI00166C2D86|nr:helix-turn-helix domain-containing protein [Deinococcus aerolatus]
MTAPLAHDAEDFWQVYTASTCAVERRRAQFFALLAEGRHPSEVLHVTRYSQFTAYELMARYRELGLAGLRDGRQNNRGAPRVLTAEQQQEACCSIASGF